MPGVLPTDGLALDALEDFQLDAASADVAENRLQVCKKRHCLAIAAFGPGAKRPQTRPGDVPRAQGRVVAAFGTSLDFMHETLRPRLAGRH